MKKTLKIMIVLAVLAAAAFALYRYLQPQEKTAYITEPVRRGSISQTVSATGEISSSHLVDVGAQASGQIKKMYVKIGQRVEKGDLIAEIDSTTQLNQLNTNRAKLETYEAELVSAQVALGSAEKKYRRYQSLQAEDAVSKEDLDSAADAYAAAKAKIKELQSNIKQMKITINTSEADLGYTRIVAPSAGTVVALVVEEGQTVNAVQSTPTIVQIADLDTMLNKMQIAEGDITKVKAGQNISFTILSEPDQPLTGKLDSIDPGLTTMSQGSYSKSTDTSSSAIYYYARALIPNPEGKLAIGMSTQNTIEINRADNVLLIPATALKQQGADKVVRVLGKDGKAGERKVTVGLKDAINVEIKSGLKEGEQVVISEMSAGEQESSANIQMGGPPR